MTPFVTDIVIEAKDLCNLDEDFKKLKRLVSDGQRAIFVGRRNTGKTSLVKSKLIPWFCKEKMNGLAIFIDLMGVKSLDQINHLFSLAFEKAYGQTRPAQSFLKKLMQMTLKSRPTFSVDPLTQGVSFSLAPPDSPTIYTFQEILTFISAYHKDHNALLVMDEFQDIGMVEQAEARLRDSLQNLPGDLPVVVLGSKQHLLTEIFTKPRAPFAGWGRYLEISKITVEEYMPYINERLKPAKMQKSEVAFLLEQMEFIPEAVNLVCLYLQRHSVKVIDQEAILHAVQGVIEERSSLFRHLLSFYTEKEQYFLHALSKVQPLKQPYSSQFLSRIKMSTGAARPLIKRLENDGIILFAKDGYQVSDPLMTEFLRRN